MCSLYVCTTDISDKSNCRRPPTSLLAVGKRFMLQQARQSLNIDRMSGQSYSYYMRPQDRDGNNHAHATGRGRSQHLAPSRGRSRERSYDRMSHHRDNRDMRGEARSDQYHRSRSSDCAPDSRGHRSRSFDLHPFPYNYSSSSNYSSQRDSSYHDNSSRKRSRSPSRPNQRNLQNNEYDRPRSQ